MTDNRGGKRPARRPDCVTEVRMGNTVLVVSGYFKEDTTATVTAIPGWKRQRKNWRFDGA